MFLMTELGHANVIGLGAAQGLEAQTLWVCTGRVREMWPCLHLAPGPIPGSTSQSALLSRVLLPRCFCLEPAKPG